MDAQWDQLQEELAERRKREAEAAEMVARLAGEGAEEIADVVTGWMNEAYGVEPSDVATPKGSNLAVRLLTRGEGRSLLAVLPGDMAMTQKHIQDARDAAWGVQADSIIVASLQPVDDAVAEEAHGKDVRLWGHKQIETVYCETGREVGGAAS